MIQACYVFPHSVTVFSEDEPGKQVKSAIGIKNTSKSHVAFKVSIDSSKTPFCVFPLIKYFTSFTYQKLVINQYCDQIGTTIELKIGDDSIRSFLLSI